MLVRKLKRLGLIASAMAGVAVCASAALGDSEYYFSFYSTDTAHSVSGSGTLELSQTNNDAWSYTATSGTITLPDPTVSNTSSGFTGTFGLDSGANDAIYSSAGLSPDGHPYYLSNDGYFYFDDQIYLPQPANKDLPGFLLDVGGLLFTDGDASNPQEINLYQSGNYVYYENNGMNVAVDFSITPVPSSLNSSGSAVPLPAAANVGFGMLAGCGLLAGLRKRLRRSRCSAMGV